VTETLDVVLRQWFVTEHVREKFSCRSCETITSRRLELADIASKARNSKPTTISPIAFEAAKKFDAIFMLERSINGLSPEARVTARRKDIALLVNDLIDWMKRERGKLSRHNEVAKAMDYMLKRVDVFTRFLDDGRICLSNNAAEREVRGIAMGGVDLRGGGSRPPSLAGARDLIPFRLPASPRRLVGQRRRCVPDSSV
jgi:hypothetical protein